MGDLGGEGKEGVKHSFECGWGGEMVQRVISWLVKEYNGRKYIVNGYSLTMYGEGGWDA